MKRCEICGKLDCKEHAFSVGKVVKIDSFAGSSPPEVFVGRWNYPNVYTGILAPQSFGDTRHLSSHEDWHKHTLSIDEVIAKRSELIYGRTQSFVKRPTSKFMSVMQEIAMTHKSTATEFQLAKKIRAEKHPDSRVPLMSNTAPVEKVQLQENTKIKKKVDYLVNDTDTKAATAIHELATSNISTSNIIKLLSAGLLGHKKNRKLVPTRWAITATDDALSKEKLDRIRHYPVIDAIKVFSANYVGNYYWFILLPDKYSFEVIEAKMMGTTRFMQDYESFFPRKKYADEVTGAYYANRLALTEYLDKHKRQAQCLVLREVRPEYNAPLGVGILREVSREAFKIKPREFENTTQAMQAIAQECKLPITEFTQRSWLLKNYGKQARISDFF